MAPVFTACVTPVAIDASSITPGGRSRLTAAPTTSTPAAFRQRLGAHCTHHHIQPRAVVLGLRAAFYLFHVTT